MKNQKMIAIGGITGVIIGRLVPYDKLIWVILGAAVMVIILCIYLYFPVIMRD